MGEREGLEEGGPAASAPAPEESAPAPEERGLIEMVLTEHAERVAQDPAPRPERVEGVVIGVLCGIRGPGEPLVDFDSNPAGEPVPARSAVTLDDAALGRRVALMFEGGDPARPLLIGLVHDPAPAAASQADRAIAHGRGAPVEVEADGERVVVSAARELVLRCGEASITLTRAGKILIRGAYVLTRSSGVNRIQGGTVEIN